jgi:16S rRNA A1518/A1519 N6-dimethyltransferase RsmA/KsgA/DIM1 with predicted DNA glycosylase/AP lyase activity
MLIEKARLTKDDDVLEIGTGWGTFAIHVRSMHAFAYLRLIHLHSLPFPL